MPSLIARDVAIEHFVESHRRGDDQQPQPPVVLQPLTETVHHRLPAYDSQILARTVVRSSGGIPEHWPRRVLPREVLLGGVSADRSGEAGGVGSWDAVSFACSDDRAGDCVEFWLMSGCDVLLH
jgi:hypothetical protein